MVMAFFVLQNKLWKETNSSLLMKPKTLGSLMKYNTLPPHRYLLLLPIPSTKLQWHWMCSDSGYVASFYMCILNKLYSFTFLCYLHITRTQFLCPPWKRGHIVLQLSVGQYIGRSVDQVLSAQYLLTPSLDQYQTWCRGYPQWVDDPYWFSGHMFKGQGQTILLSPVFKVI